jgi:hypothetical protein
MAFLRDLRFAGRAVGAVTMAAACAVLLTACGGERTETAALTSNAAPVALTPKATASSAGALTGPVNDAELRKAVDRYRVTKQRTESQYDFAGVDLNGDGKSEALVLFSGQDWCVQTGCSLVVFQEEATGYKVISHVTRVRPPVLIGPEANFGWRDLMVATGGGPAPVRTVRLGFSGKGYPINALLQPEPLQEMLSRSQQVMAESPSFAAALNQAVGQSTGESPEPTAQ